jgi:hypothetical protein
LWTQTNSTAVKQAQIDHGIRPGVSSQEQARIKQLEKENAELRANAILRTASAFFALMPDPVNVYPFIEAEKVQRRNVKRACVLLKVSRSAYYADRAAGPSQRERDDAELTDAIVAVHDESDGTYGAPPGAR